MIVDLIVFIIILLSVSALICLIVGLVSPALFTWFFKKNLGRGQTSLIFGGITVGLLMILFIIATISTASSSVPQETAQKKAVIVAKVLKPTISPENVLVSHEKKLKAIDDTMLYHDFKLATKCAYVINDVANGNLSSLSDWSTANDTTFETFMAEGNKELNAINGSKEGTASADIAVWNKLADLDGTIDNDLGNVEGVCDNFVTDPLAQSNASTYESEVKSDQEEISTLMDQRKTILASLGY